MIVGKYASRQAGARGDGRAGAVRGDDEVERAMLGPGCVGQHGLVVSDLNAGDCAAETDVNRLGMDCAKEGGEQRAAMDTVRPKTGRVGEANEIASVLADRMKFFDRR